MTRLNAAVAVFLAASACASIAITPSAHAKAATRDGVFALAKRSAVQAPPGARLPANSTLTRIAVGSCNQQENPQTFWPTIASENPQLFLMIGDNVYGDVGWDGKEDLRTFRAAYEKLAANRHFADFRQAVPMMETWDDHDFGPNDGGGSFQYKAASEALFEHFWDAPYEVRKRPGVYRSAIYGPSGRKVQLILLDTRFFRTNLAELPPTERGKLGKYAASTDPAADMLGQDQWHWLQQELEKPADLRVIVSSIQVLTSAHNFESWANFPMQRQKLLNLLAARAPSGVVLLSGDRHAGALYSTSLPGGEVLWEMTASSLNAPMKGADTSSREPDALRRGPLFGQTNFGMLEIDWDKRAFAVSLTGTNSTSLTREWVAF